MKIFPSKDLKFKLLDEQEDSLKRLKRRTDKSENLISRYTEKSFRGIIAGNEFKLISSAIGKGAFCVMTGKIDSEKGNVKIEIHKVFRILLSIMLSFPIIGLVILIRDFSPISILVAIGQILIIRYAFIGLAFKFLSKESLNRLRDVIDFEWINK